MLIEKQMHSNDESAGILAMRYCTAFTVSAPAYPVIRFE